MKLSKGKQALVQVAEWLEAGAPHVGDVAGFDLSVGVAYETPNSCGTVCCIAGALVQFNNPVTEFLKDQIDYDDYGLEYNWGDVFAKGRDIAYLDDETAEALFEPELWDRSEITPAQAARVIRHYVETGKVDWDVAFDE